MLTSLSSSAQSTSLTYKVKGKNNYNGVIQFTSEIGSTELSPETFFGQSNVYFMITADPSIGKGVFRESDVEDLISNIKILQNEKLVSQSTAAKTILNASDKIDKVIMAFPKSDVMIYDSIAFSVNGAFSKKLRLSEEYFESFEPTKRIFDQAKSSESVDDHLKSHAEFFRIYKLGEEQAEVKALSFYNDAMQKLDASVSSYLDYGIQSVAKVQATFNTEETEESLKALTQKIDEVKENLVIFNEYFNSEIEKSAELKSESNSLSNEISEIATNGLEQFKSKRMAVLETGNYSNYQFSTYIDLIARLYTFTDTLWLMESLPVIDVSKVDVVVKEYSDLYDDQKKDFGIIINLLNENMKNGLVFNDKLMQNLEMQLESQKQPYFEFFAALNAYSQDKDLFESYLREAIVKCSDDQILKGIEFWQLSYSMTKDRIGKQTLSQINEGANLIARKRWNQAEDKLNMLKRQASGFAPVWYYTGELKYNMGEFYSAEVQFKRALTLNPEYIAPRKYILEIFSRDSSYAQLLSNSEEAIATFDTWTFRYYKALALFKLKKYEEAITEVLEQCLPKNNWDVNQYYLLGDAYLELGQFDKAKESYTKTQEIDPFTSDSKRFDDAMRKVYQNERNQQE